MRMKSSHILGTLELVGEISDIRVKDGWLLMNLRTTTPAGWNLKAALSYADLWDLMKLMCRPRNLVCFIFGFCRRRDKGRIPEY